jgi:hypothetical protein
MYLLDTNHCSQAILGNTNVLRRLEYIENSVITTCAIVQGELIDMAERSQRKESNLVLINRFLIGIYIHNGVIMQIATPSIDSLSGEITLLGEVFDKLREIKTELADHDYILAIKAYQERLPIRCTGDLVKVDNHFLLENPHNLLLNNI